MLRSEYVSPKNGVYFRFVFDLFILLQKFPDLVFVFGASPHFPSLPVLMINNAILKVLHY